MVDVRGRNSMSNDNNAYFFLKNIILKKVFELDLFLFVLSVFWLQGEESLRRKAIQEGQNKREILMRQVNVNTLPTEQVE